MIRYLILLAFFIPFVGCGGRFDPQVRNAIDQMQSEIMAIEDQYYDLDARYRAAQADLENCRQTKATLASGQSPTPAKGGGLLSRLQDLRKESATTSPTTTYRNNSIVNPNSNGSTPSVSSPPVGSGTVPADPSEPIIEFGPTSDPAFETAPGELKFPEEVPQTPKGNLPAPINQNPDQQGEPEIIGPPKIEIPDNVDTSEATDEFNVVIETC